MQIFMISGDHVQVAVSRREAELLAAFANVGVDFIPRSVNDSDPVSTMAFGSWRKWNEAVVELDRHSGEHAAAAKNLGDRLRFHPRVPGLREHVEQTASTADELSNTAAAIRREILRLLAA